MGVPSDGKSGEAGTMFGLAYISYVMMTMQDSVEASIRANKTECIETVAEDDIDLLSRLISAECGSDWCDDRMLYLTGAVVLNRVKSERFPDTIYDVIYQDGQYAVVANGSIEKKPVERAVRIAEELLTGYDVPSDVLFQAEFSQGEVYEIVQNMFFCRG